MTLDELINFAKKRGFWDTFRILSQYSYYNFFLRIKHNLIEKGLIAIERKSNKKAIRLTQKGKTVLAKLIELDSLLKS